MIVLRNDRTRGFTLVELLLSTSILGIILGSISTALIVFFRNAEYTLERDDHSAGASVSASYLDRDLASADDHQAAGTACSGVANALVLTWGEAKASVAVPEPDADGAGTFTAAYSLVVDAASVPKDGGTRYKLQRTYCTNGALVDKQTLAVNLRAGDFGVDAASGATCGGSADELTVSLKNYLDDTASDYAYTGCLKGRLR